MVEKNNDAPLETIRSKERELAVRLKDAEERANEKLARARMRAGEICRDAELTGQREAEQFFLDEMTRAEKAGETIRDAARREAEQLTRRGEQYLDRAAQIVIDFIFPK